MSLKKINLEIVVFFCGAVVMAYEIIGSRILGPYAGTSMTVWSSIIGIILLSLSIGYSIGGRVADRHPDPLILAAIIGSAGVFILLSLLFKESLLIFLARTLLNIHLVSVVSSLLLFTIPALLLGMVSPFAARLKIKDTQTAGATVGYLYALSTIGSITGTFLAGFYLIPGYTLTSIMVILGMVLLALTLFLFLTCRNQWSTSIKENFTHEKS